MKNPVEEHELRRVGYLERLLAGLVFRLPAPVRDAVRLPRK